MPYTSYQDILKRFPEMITSGRTPEDIETALVADGDAVIDARLGRRYVVPFASEPEATPPIIRRIATSLATMDLIDKFPNTPDWIIRRIQRDVDLLDRLASGDDVIVGVTGTVVAERADVSTIRVSTSQWTPTFGVAPSLNETIDPDRQDAEDAARE